MSNLGDIFYLAVLVLAASAVNGRLAWPDAPYGSIVAVAKLTSRDKSSVVRGSMALVWPRPNMGNASVSLNLTGALDQITMAHIRLVGAGRGRISGGAFPLFGKGLVTYCASS
ncbi:hypothetical protein Vretifemale_18491 [Volvox reticuliferus]|uniref:Pherophorin domain-containing protein n=1 Tax=Volvox reticuliferus TaxID=1737510 RepID=A0A8J4D0W7_9CHLO|nr:hypothetical protein Vretifemale_18491 [Volvox reticuliferus]